MAISKKNKLSLTSLTICKYFCSKLFRLARAFYISPFLSGTDALERITCQEVPPFLWQVLRWRHKVHQTMPRHQKLHQTRAEKPILWFSLSPASSTRSFFKWKISQKLWLIPSSKSGHEIVRPKHLHLSCYGWWEVVQLIPLDYLPLSVWMW